MLKRIVIFTILFAFYLPVNAEEKKLDELIKSAHANPNVRSELLTALMSGHVVIIASWENEESKNITIQDFIRSGQTFIPIFSDDAHFKSEIAGSGFENKGVSIDSHLLASMLRGHELLVLNPGSQTPIDINAKELKSLINPERL